MSRSGHRLGALLLAALATSAGAAELEVFAPVVDVQPLGPALTALEACPARPAASAGLTAMLAWDLGVSCTIERRPAAGASGYRVFYRWDDRVYSRVMATAPGATVPLKVRLD